MVKNTWWQRSLKVLFVLSTLFILMYFSAVFFEMIDTEKHVDAQLENIRIYGSNPTTSTLVERLESYEELAAFNFSDYLKIIFYPLTATAVWVILCLLINRTILYVVYDQRIFGRTKKVELNS